MDRLSALDAEFLHLEDGANHMHIGACAVFDGPAPEPDELHTLMAAAVGSTPRYRQRVRAVPLQLGRPVWVDDPDFDLDDHVAHLELAAPADDHALQALVADLMSTELDRGRPLWEAWFVTGLADGRWAMVAKVHHCMVDGLAGVALMAAVLATTPDAALPTPAAWTPDPGPTETRLVVDALGEVAGDLWAATREVVGALASPADATRSLRTLAGGTLAWLQEAWPTGPTSIEGPVGAERSWTWVDVPLADAKAIRRDRGGTVNDVVLAAVTRGLRDLLLAHGEDPTVTQVRCLVPVSVRPPEGAERFDNEVSALVAELPVEITVPELRYEAIRNEIQWLKLSHEAEAGEAVTGLADLVPAPAMAWGTKAVAAVLRRHPQRSITTVATNVPGPPVPLFALGRRLLAYRPFVPVALGVRVAVAVLSYDGTLSFGVTGDQASVPDVDVVAKGIQAGVDELRDDRDR